MSNSTIIINKDYYIRPAGRFRTDGEYNAERFRDDFLIPRLNDHDIVTLDFNGTRPCGSSFLEEVFGGLIRKGFDKNRVKVVSNDEMLNPEIQTYMDEETLRAI